MFMGCILGIVHLRERGVNPSAQGQTRLIDATLISAPLTLLAIRIPAAVIEIAFCSFGNSESAPLYSGTPISQPRSNSYADHGARRIDLNTTTLPWPPSSIPRAARLNSS